MRNKRHGFTLLEVTVALAISGLVVLLTYRTLVGIVDSSAQLAAARTELDRDMNTRRWLTETLGSLEIVTPGGGFSGQSNRVEFDAGQHVSQWGLETRHITLSRGGDSLVAKISADQVTLFRGIRSFACDYLLEPGAGATWLRQWVSPLSAPLAVRCRIGYENHADTLLLLVGPRG